MSIENKNIVNPKAIGVVGIIISVVAIVAIIGGIIFVGSAKGAEVVDAVQVPSMLGVVMDSVYGGVDVGSVVDVHGTVVPGTVVPVSGVVVSAPVASVVVPVVSVVRAVVDVVMHQPVVS